MGPLRAASRRSPLRTSKGGHVAKVRYIDFDDTAAMDGFNKRRELETEREIRAAFYDFSQCVDLAQGKNRAHIPVGQTVRVVLPELILKVRLAPQTADCLVSAVKGVTRGVAHLVEVLVAGGRDRHILLQYLSEPDT